MFLFEFNNLDLEDKRDYINQLPTTSNDKGWFVTFRKEGDMFISLWDCDTYFAEMYALNRKVLKIEGIELDDSRIDKYIDYAKEAEAKGEDFNCVQMSVSGCNGHY
jgi:hypothetical protein